MKLSLLFSLLAAGAPFAAAVETRTWIQAEQADFEKANLKNVSLRSDGRMFLAPRFQERFDSSMGYLWTLAQDSKGNVYSGGGPGAKLFRMTPAGDKKTLAELEGLEIHAIVVDKKDRVFVATSPDGKIFEVGQDGKSKVFYDPKAKYIWALAFAPNGDLLAATGDEGKLHRIAPDGKGSVVFQSEDNHLRSMAVDSSGNVILGTEPGGLILRVNATGEGFVVHQMAKKEVTAVAVAADGQIYAAGAGTKQAAPALPVTPAPVAVTPPGAPGQAMTPQRVALVPITMAVPQSATPSVGGGSEVVRVAADGYTRRIWSHGSDIVYALGFDGTGKLLIGTGNKGAIYRLESENRYSTLISAAPTQITAFLAAGAGRLFVATGNVGKVYEMGPGPEPSGTIESEIFDSGIFSQWGRVSLLGSANGGSISVMTRSGNLDRAQKNWSSWSAAAASFDGGRAQSPASRFAQWKITLTASADGRSPDLDEVDLAYLPRNVAPRVEAVEGTPFNYRFAAPSALTVTTPAQTLNLPAIGKRPSIPSAASSETAPTSMTYAKGHVGVRWAAADDNGDSLLFTVQIRGVNEADWKPLREKVRERALSFDSTAFPDGRYRVRVIASDAPSNPAGSGLTAQLDSEPFLIDNTPPAIGAISARRAGGSIEFGWKAADALSVIEKAEYSLDGGDWTLVLPSTQLSDSKEHEYVLSLPAGAGEHTFSVRTEDEFGNVSAAKTLVPAAR